MLFLAGFAFLCLLAAIYQAGRAEMWKRRAAPAEYQWKVFAKRQGLGSWR